jgi:F0F1-type ATP synthase assembly protein I
LRNWTSVSRGSTAVWKIVDDMLGRGPTIMTAMSDREAAPPPDDWEEQARRVVEEADEAERLRRIEEELDKVKDTVRLAEPDEDLERRMDEIAERARASKARLAATKAEEARSAAVSGETARGLGHGLAIAYAILGVPLVGYGLGWLADRQMGGNVWQAVGTVTGAVMALVYAVRTMNRA